MHFNSVIPDELLKQEHSSSVSATQQKLTESVTLRFDKDILDKLKNEAKDKQISLNTLLNQSAI
ncbi:MAG: BrnA antitoxin family protein [Thermoproteota archaeon]|nr:BrnA antitoxin family protein [Thermoproteota archaeon]